MSLTDEEVLCMVVHLGDYYYTEKGIIQAKENNDTPVICKVPSYEEYLESEAHCSVYSEKNAELIETNDSLSRQVKHLLDLQRNQDKEVESLRDLLKECKANFIHRKQLLEKLEELENPTIDLITRINTAIGESDE